MKKLMFLMLLVASVAGNAQVTTAFCFEPIGYGLGGKVGIQFASKLGMYSSYTTGMYKILLPHDHVSFSKLCVGVTYHLVTGAYFQGGVVYSKWSDNYEGKHVLAKPLTAEGGFGYKYPCGINIGIRFNPFKSESSFDLGYTFNLSRRTCTTKQCET